LRGVATAPAARGLADDAAVLAPPLGNDLVATHDMLAEGVHFTSTCPPRDIGWKLAAVNLSDLAAMGARPLAALFGAGIGAGREPGWAADIARGLAACLEANACPLIGGDTIRQPGGTSLSLTALGHLPHGVALSRAGASAGDDLWVSGTIGDAGLGLEIALGTRPSDRSLLARYRRPTPRLALGMALRGLASAAMDVSDGLLLDAGRLARASGLTAVLAEARIPLSPAARASGLPPRRLATLGDDYELLFASPEARRATIEALPDVTRIGTLAPRDGAADLVLLDDSGAPVALAETGWRHA
jgi:thiamine-monophosphate kinase